MEDRKSKVAWSGDTKTSGTADKETQKKLIDMLNELGTAIEQEANISELNFYLFPIFRKFESAGIVTDKNIFYVISPYGGDIPWYVWADIRKKPDQLTKDRILGWARDKQGWTSPWLIELDIECIRESVTEAIVTNGAERDRK